MKYTYNAIFLKIPTFIKDALCVFCQMLNPYSWLSTFSISACWCHWYWLWLYNHVLFTCVYKKDDTSTDVNFVINVFEEEERDKYVFKRNQHKCQICHMNSHDIHLTLPCCWNKHHNTHFLSPISLHIILVSSLIMAINCIGIAAVSPSASSPLIVILKPMERNDYRFLCSHSCISLTRNYHSIRISSSQNVMISSSIA